MSSFKIILLSAFISSAFTTSIPPPALPLHCLHSTSTPLSHNLLCSSTGAGDLLTFISTLPSLYIVVDPTTLFFPWSYQPVCTPLLESVGSSLCVYTNASFSSDRGVSIFTTPQIAAEFSALSPFKAATFDGINEHESERSPWYTQQMEGKGVGMLARKKLKRKDLITAYTPVLLVYMEQELSMLSKEQLLRTAINQLPPRTRRAYLALSTIYGDPDLVVQDILKANTFEIEIGGVMHLALIPETSRINHACNPNSQYYFDADLFAHFVHAVRPIAQGEEITISYTDPFNPTPERQEHLLTSFHFTCHCPRCSKTSTTDITLSKITSLRSSLSDWERSDQKPHFTATVAQAKELIQTFRTEGLDAFLDVAYGHAVLTYSAIGDAKNAMRYAKLAADAVRMTNGPHAQDFRLWDGIVEGGIEGHWSWRFRVL